MSDFVALYGFMPRETEKSIALVKASDTRGQRVKPLYIPRSKINSIVEKDLLCANVKLAGEDITRQGIPVTVLVDEDFLNKIRVDPADW